MIQAVVGLVTPAWAESTAPATAPAASQPEPVPALAVDPVTSAKDAEAKAAQLFREDRFTEAATLLRLAYDKQPRPILLFNAGQAFRKAEHAAEAKAMYEQFLAAAPDHALGAEARGYIKDMETLLSVQERAKQVAFALEEQLAATQSSQKQVAHKLEEERQRSLQIQQELLHTRGQLERQKALAHRRLVLALSIGIPLLTLGAGAIGVAGFFSARVRTSGGTITLGE